ncbi:MAG: hypothetical protein EOP06_30485 [Proteobacteria bacterium]|nr:MAG: hypothetical protein EOP06_30485 [Pseudomonadota bacterium]
MRNEAEKGDFPQLVSFFAGTYHQDIWFEFSSHEEVWADFVKHDAGSAKVLIHEIETALSLEPTLLFEHISPSMKSNGFGLSEEELPQFLNEVRKYLQKNTGESIW